MRINIDHQLPDDGSQAMSKDWAFTAGGVPVGITWHWSAGHTLEDLDRVLGYNPGAEDPQPERRGEASAHFGIGRDHEEGVHQYLDPRRYRSWHASKNQTLRFDGKSALLGRRMLTGSRSTIGIEVVHVGFARRGIPAQSDWIEVDSPDGRQTLQVAPWPDEQIDLCVALGKHLVNLFPRIRPEHHHGHVDLCPGYKLDPLSFPYARVLRGIYDDPDIADVWTPFLTTWGRQRALVLLGHDLGRYGPARDGVDGQWGRASDHALMGAQVDLNLEPNMMWTSHVSRAVYAELLRLGIDPAEVLAAVPTET